MREIISRQVLIAALFLGDFGQRASAAEHKEWVKLTDCRYVDGPDNDGDSFRVRSGDKEFTARLYYVDAPETNLRQGERTHDQSLYFGITLDETMKAGEKAKQRTKELLQKPFVIWTRFWSVKDWRGRKGSRLIYPAASTRRHTWNDWTTWKAQRTKSDSVRGQ